MNSGDLHISLNSLVHSPHDGRSALHETDCRLPVAVHDEPDSSWDAWIDLGGEG